MNIARYWLWSLITVALLAAGGLAERLPLQKKSIDFKFPEHYEKWHGPPDPRTGIAREHDPKPRLVPLDEKSARYAFIWVGVDGKGKQVIYERPDAIEAVVTASVKEVSGQYQYVYKVTNLPSSGQRLTGFVVQYFSGDTVPTEVANCYIGKMFHGLTAFKQGEWIRFAPYRGFNPPGYPGETVQVELKSTAPPGIVECRAHGSPPSYKGGHSMPYEFNSLLLGHDYWPHGYTIGPMERLKSLSPRAHLAYVAQLLPQLEELGWINAGVVSWYERNLKPGTPGLYQQVERDFNAGKITTEVFSLLQATKR